MVLAGSYTCAPQRRHTPDSILAFTVDKSIGFLITASYPGASTKLTWTHLAATSHDTAKPAAPP